MGSSAPVVGRRFCGWGEVGGVERGDEEDIAVMGLEGMDWVSGWLEGWGAEWV